MNDRQQLEKAIAAFETQRAELGDAVVDAGIAAMKAQLAAPAPPQPEQRRKLVTLLFCDVAGSTTMVRDLDPEDNLAIMDTGLKRLSEHIGQFGGRVTRYMGDGFKALFGYPAARENDAEMAIRAGLAILHEAQAYAGEVEARYGVRGYAVRVGINTGLVVVGGELEGEDAVVGAAVNLAARMESAAQPGTLLISHDTYLHVRGVFDLQPLEPIVAKGFETPVPVYRVLSARQHSFRSRRRGIEGIETRMIGREIELKTLQEMLERTVADSQRRMITLVGEAGLGKSRLLYEFESWVALQPDAIRIFRGRARQETRNQSFGLLRDLFAAHFQVQDSDPAPVVSEKMMHGFVELFGPGVTSERNAHILGQLLGYDFRDSPHVHLLGDDARQLRDRGLMYAEQYFKAAAEKNPVVMLLEDLHWADDSSLDAIAQVVMAAHTAPILIIGTSRPELYQRRPHWFESQDFHRRLDLHPLARETSGLLVDEVLQRVEKLPAMLRQLIVDRAEGNPFYVEELIKMLIEEGAIVKAEPHWRVVSERLDTIRVPTTLTGVLQTRLDALPEIERAVLQQASVVGRVFWDTVLDYMGRSNSPPHSAVEPSGHLPALLAREMVFRRESSTFAAADEYLFKNALLRDVAYETVLKRLRRTYHDLTAEWLVQVSAEQGRADEYAALIADHFEAAGRNNEARVWLRRAGDAAAARYANHEAVVYYERLVPLLEETEAGWEARLRLVEVLELAGRYDEAERHCRLALTSTNASPIDATFLFALGKLNRLRGDYDTALDWLRQAGQRWFAAGDPKGTAQALVESGIVLWSRGDYLEARRQTSDAMRLAQAADAPSVVARALVTLGLVATAQGDYPAARAQLEESLALFRQIGDKRGIASTLTQLGDVVLAQGELAVAQGIFEECLVLFREMGASQGIASALNHLGLVAEASGDAETAQAMFEDCLTLSRNIGFKLGIAAALTNLGLVTAMRKQYDAAQRLLLESLRLFYAMGVKRGIPSSLVGLAAVAAGSGHNPDRAAQLLGAIEAACATLGLTLEPMERLAYLEATKMATTTLGEEAFTAAFAEGQAMTLDEAVTYALSDEPIQPQDPTR